MSLTRYPSYVDANVEWLEAIPAEWKIKKLRHLVRIDKRIVGELGHDVLSITQRGLRVKDVESNEGQLSMDYSKYQRVEVGDFAMNHMDLLTGFVDQARQDGVTSPDYRVFSLQANKGVQDGFLLRVLQNGYQQKIFYAYGQGSSQLGRWRLPTSAFLDFCIPVPPEEDQGAISSFLDRETAKIDALIAEQQRLIELLQEKRQTVISHAVTKGLNPNAPMKDSGVEWLGEVPEHWSVVEARREIDFLTSGSRGWAEFYSDDGYLFLRIGNLTRNSIDLDLEDIQRVSPPDGAEGARTEVKEGDVLFSITAYLGSVAVVPEALERAYVSQHVCLVRLNGKNLLPKWLAYAVLSASGRAYLEAESYGGTKIQLSLDDTSSPFRLLSLLSKNRR